MLLQTSGQTEASWLGNYGNLDVKLFVKKICPQRTEEGLYVVTLEAYKTGDEKILYNLHK